MAIIEGVEFSLFWDVDRQKLKNLSFIGRTEWLHRRVEEVLVKPLTILEKAADAQTLVWLAVTELICAGIEALAGFYGNCQHGVAPRSKQKPFCLFVYTFMHKDFSKTSLNAEGKDWTYCQHLQEYFRGGLDHGFSIEWGGLWHNGENGMVGYLRPANDGNGIAIDPRELLSDFRQAMEAYFGKLTKEGENSIAGKNFQVRFTRILDHRGRTR